MVCSSRPYPFKFFKGCLRQILLGPFLNTLSHIKNVQNLILTYILRCFICKEKNWETYKGISMIMSNVYDRTFCWRLTFLLTIFTSKMPGRAVNTPLTTLKRLKLISFNFKMRKMTLFIPPKTFRRGIKKEHCPDMWWRSVKLFLENQNYISVLINCNLY